jgi:hypothetical protein
MKLKDLLKILDQQEEYQKTCKHTKVITSKNTGDYKLRVQCKTCGKLLKWEFKERGKENAKYKSKS